MLKNEAKYFQHKLMHWHEHFNERQLPWKGEKDVYRIWLSEIILQQTRAEQGWRYYERFLKAYPTIQKLAKAPIEEVFKLWEGLGYYNRCRNLHATAQKIVFELKGRFPDTYETILKLKGVGPYTAAAIASFAYDLPYAVVDGNVFRVLSRFFGEETQVDSTKGKKLFEQLAQQCLAKDDAAAYNQAIMDFGATVCKPDNPLCSTCPLKNKCVAFIQNTIMHLPVKEKRLKLKSRWFVFYVLEHKQKIAVQQRMAKDVWQHLYQFPLIEFSSEKEWKTFLKKDVLQQQSLFNGQGAEQIAITKPVVQKLSHQTIHAVAAAVKLKQIKKQMKGVEWKSRDELNQLPFPQIIHQFMKGKLMEVF
jgi:A/G-specific adenine glycosylase